MGELVYIGLGSNLDDPAVQIKTALNDINAIEQTKLIKDSGLFKSRPMGPQDQPDYLNAAALIETELDEITLLEQLQKIENAHGRIRQRHWGERTLDLDILLFADLIISTERLTIPHPGLAEREFVLYPLENITPELVVPGLGTLKQLMAACPANGIEYIG